MPARSEKWHHLNRTIRALEKTHGLDRSAHQALISDVCNKTSLADCSLGEMQKIINQLNQGTPKAKARGSKQDFRKSNKGYVRKVWGLTMELDKIGYWNQPYKQALQAMVKKMTGVDHPDWLDWNQAEAVIEALKAIIARERVQK